MADTPKIRLRYMTQSVDQKEVLYSESMDSLAALVQCNVKDRDLSAPPASPVDGDTYIVKTAGTGAWAGHDNDIAIWISAQWKFHDPLEGWRVYLQDENLSVFYDGAAWQADPTQGNFLALSDTPGSYAGQANKVVSVNAAATGLEFTTAAAGVSTFLALTDTPASYTGQGLKFTRVNAGATALEFATGVVATFLDLTDTPSSYAAQGGKLVGVKSDATGLEFLAAAGGALALEHGALLSLTADQLLADDTPTHIPWDQAEYQTLAFWASGEPTALVIPAGVTRIYIAGQVEFDGAPVGNRSLTVLLNGVPVVGCPAVNLSADNLDPTPPRTIVNIASLPFDVAEGDTLELEAWQDSGTDATIVASTLTWFGLVVVGPVEWTVHTKTLTDAVTDLFDIALPAGAMAGGKVFATIRASNGTDHQILTQTVEWGAVNKAGTYTTQLIIDAASEIAIATTGTLTAVWSVLNGTNKITVRVTPTGSLTETTYDMRFTVVNNSPQQITYL